MSTIPPKKPSPMDYHVTDLSTYKSDVEKFKAYLRKVRTKEDVDRLLREFDEEQQRHWKDHAHKD